MAMATDQYYENVSEFSAGAVIARSFSTFFKHPFVFVALCVLAQLPGIAIVLLAPEGKLASKALSSVFGLAIQGAVACGVYEVLRGSPARFGKSISKGMSRVLPLIAAVFSGVAFSMLLILPGLLLCRVLGDILGTAVMFLAGAFLWTKWSVFIPVCVVERLGPIESLNRSSELTKDCRLKIAGVYLLCSIIWAAFSFSATFLLRASIMAFVRTFGAALGLIFFLTIHQLVLTISLTFIEITTAVIYYGLREAKEGVTVDSLANVFD